MQTETRKSILLFCAALFSLAAPAWEVDMQNKTLILKKDGGSVVDASKRSVLNFQTVPKTDFSLLKAELADKQFILDTRKFFEKNNKGYVLIFWQGLNISDFVFPAAGRVFSDKANIASLHCSEGTPGLQFFGSVKSKKGGFYSRTQVSEVKNAGNGGICKISTETRLPADAAWVSLRQVFTRPGVYKISSAKLSVEKIRKAETADKNWIYNGSAEQGGMYNPMVRFEYNEWAHTGEYRDWLGKRFVYGNKILAIDSKEKHSGKYSFCVGWDGADDSYAPGISFAPVPVKPRETVALSAWIKAEEPTIASLSLSLNGGTRVSRHISVGTEWNRYEMMVPSWGEKTPGVHVSPNILTVQGAEFNLIIPSVGLAKKGKIWIDDVVYCLGGPAKDWELEEVYLSGTLDRPAAYYFTGEPIRIDLAFNSLSERPLSGRLSYELRNFEGKKIAEKSLRELTLKPREDRNESIMVTLPPELRGAFNVVVTFQTAKSAHSANFYAGVIGKNAKLSPRVGIEYLSNQNTKLTIPYYLDFGIGAARISWNPFHPLTKDSFEVASDMADAGIKILFSVASPLIVLNPEKFDPVFKEKLKKFKGKFEFFESINEANLISGITPKRNVEAIRRLHDMVKAIDFAAKIAGPASCATDLPWTESVLALGGANYLDVVTEHPYRNSPESPDYAAEVRDWRKMINRYKKDMPHYASEAGRCQEPSLPGNLIDDFTRLQTARDIRNILQAFAGGVERYMQFAFCSWLPGITYNVIQKGSLANNGTPIPGPAMYAIRALNDRLGDAKIDRQVKFGYDYRCYIFDHGNKRTATVWKWNGEPVEMNFAKTDAAKFAAYDLMGSKIQSDTLTLNELPVYLESTLCSAEFETLLKRGDLQNRNSLKASMEISVIDEKSFAVNIRNLTSKSLSGTLSVETANVVKGDSVRPFSIVSGEGSQSIVFQLDKGKIGSEDKRVRLSLAVPGSKKIVSEQNLRSIFVARTPSRLNIDGDLADWPESAKALRLDKTNLRWKAPAWGENEDRVHADVRFAWDYDFLYFSAVVYKTEFNGAKGVKNRSRLFLFDSIQLGFDTIKNALPWQNRLGNDDFEYDLGELDGKPLVYRRKSSSGVYDSLTKPVGAAAEVLFSMKKYPDRAVYEAAFPRRSISPFKLRPGSSMRIGVLLNLNNGKTRVGYLELTDGVSSKNPALWMDMILQP